MLALFPNQQQGLTVCHGNRDKASRAGVLLPRHGGIGPGRTASRARRLGLDVAGGPHHPCSGSLGLRCTHRSWTCTRTAPAPPLLGSLVPACVPPGASLLADRQLETQRGPGVVLKQVWGVKLGSREDARLLH